MEVCSRVFARADDVVLRLVRGVSDARQVVSHCQDVFCLVGRSTLQDLVSGEEYEFYGDVVGLWAHGKHIYLVLGTSRIVIFDGVSREVTASVRWMRGSIRKAAAGSSGAYFLCSDGWLYRSALEDIGHGERVVVDGVLDAGAVQDFWVWGDSVFYAMGTGVVCKDSRVVARVFDTVRAVVPHKEHLYIVTGRNVLLKYDVERRRAVFKIELGGAEVIGGRFVVWGGDGVDLGEEVMMRIPRDARCVSRAAGVLYVATGSGVFSGVARH